MQVLMTWVADSHRHDPVRVGSARGGSLLALRTARGADPNAFIDSLGRRLGGEPLECYAGRHHSLSWNHPRMRSALETSRALE